MQLGVPKAVESDGHQRWRRCHHHGAPVKTVHAKAAAHMFPTCLQEPHDPSGPHCRHAFTYVDSTVSGRTTKYRKERLRRKSESMVAFLVPLSRSSAAVSPLPVPGSALDHWRPEVPARELDWWLAGPASAHAGAPRAGERVTRRPVVLQPSRSASCRCHT